MSLRSRREYLIEMQRRYATSRSRQEKARLIDEVVATLGYHRKDAIRCLHQPLAADRPLVRRRRPLQYTESLAAIRLVWEALDYPRAERLHPVLLATAEQLAAHGELYLDDRLWDQLAEISRTTLSRRWARMMTDKPRRIGSPTKAQGLLRAEVPVGRFDYTEQRPGSLEIDLVEHNGGSSLGHRLHAAHGGRGHRV